MTPHTTYDNLETAIRDKRYWTPADERTPAPGATMEIVSVGPVQPVINRETTAQVGREMCAAVDALTDEMGPCAAVIARERGGVA